MFEEIWRDLRFAGRSLARRPGFTAVAVIALALGIGVNSAIFSLVNLVLFRPVMIERPEEVVGLYNRSIENPDRYRAFSYPAFRDLRERNEVFVDLAAHDIAIVGLREGERTRRIMAGVVSSGYFETFGVPPARGRGFSLEEERPGAEIPVVVLSHGLWQRLGGDPEILGTRLTINAVDVAVVGVAAEGFTGSTAVFSPELWLPLGLDARLGRPAEDGRRDLSRRDAFALMLLGRLRPGLTPDRANPRLEQLATQLREDFPATREDQTLVARPLPRLGISTEPDADDGLAVPMLLLLAMSGAVLLIACLDLTNMFLARGESRRNELAIRVALGGGRWRLLRQQLTEGLLLALAGGALGLLATVWASRLAFASFSAVMPLGMELVFDPRPDLRVVGATLAFCLVATLLSALAPAWRQSSGDVFAELKDRAASRDRSRRIGRGLLARDGLVVAQIALSMVLLTAAGLFTRGALEAERATPGFELGGSILAELDPTLVGADEERARALTSRIRQQVAALPGVTAASYSSIVPFGNVTARDRVRATDSVHTTSGEVAEARETSAHQYVIGPDYFASLGLPILRGRDFTLAEAVEGSGSPVVIVDEPLALELWPDGDPIGQLLERPVTPPERPRPPLTVIGVVPGVLHDFTDSEPPPHIYLPLGQNWISNVHLHVRLETASPAREEAAIGEIRETIRAIDPELPVLSLRTLRDHRDQALFVWIVRAGARIFTTFGLMALFLALVGVFGVKSFVMSRRRREVGLRLALGATPPVVLRQMLRESAGQAALGVGLGLLLALGAARLLSSMLYRVPPWDPAIFAGATIVLAGSVLAATWWPIRRASRVHPAVVLREE